MVKVTACLGSAAVLLALAGCTRPDDLVVPPVTSPPQAVEMSVSLYHCGFNPITHQGRTWEASPEPFDNMNKPASWRGHGTVTEVSPSRLLYRDDSGVEVTFLPEAEVPPPGPCA